jgi:hypothetical protein
VARTTIDGHTIWLLKPQTFMNLSGRAVAALARFYKIAPEEILVAHDELDILPGQVKLKRGGSHAGHNGLRDIHEQLGERRLLAAAPGHRPPGRQIGGDPLGAEETDARAPGSHRRLHRHARCRQSRCCSAVT